MTIFDILSNDDRVIVLSDAKTQTIYTWNRSLTLQAFQKNNRHGYDAWEETDIRTLPDVPQEHEHAVTRAMQWQHTRAMGD
jgi:hypothetical protein